MFKTKMINRLRERIYQYRQGRFNKKIHVPYSKMVKKHSKKIGLTEEQLKYLDKKLMEMFYGQA